MTAAVQRAHGARRGDRRLGIAELEVRLDVDRRTVARWVAAHRFPAPHHIGMARKWFESEVAAWEADNSRRPPELEQRIGNLRGATA